MSNNNQPGILVGSRFRTAEFFRGPANQQLSRLQRETTEFILVIGGLYKVTVDDVNGRPLRICAQAGDVILWPAGIRETDESVTGHPLRCIRVYLDWPHRPADLPFLVRDNDHILNLLADRLLMLSHDPFHLTGRGDEANAYLAAMVTEFMELARRFSGDLPSQVMRYTEEHMPERIRLSDLARHVGLEKNHFGRKYRQLTGRTPMQDVLRQKATCAKHILLSKPDATLHYIARSVGVRDVSKVSRLLSRYAGVSARDIRRSTRAKRYASSG
ncbi:MAG: hypothetical protein A2498_15005 [Lentisphaerae bacterium RIFOXYC12_FULL_60_16]|nr:MAG: hypothetical protein A2498_15005 [Lentisphaerae bacterium RIFOXYC12_FULL_60_16]